MLQFTLEELKELKKNIDLLHELERRPRPPLTEDLLKALVARFSIMNLFYQDPDNYIFGKPIVGACGCMGPSDGEPYCNCEMVNLRYDYRYDLALRLVELGLVKPFDPVEWDKQTKKRLLKEMKQQERMDEAKAFRTSLMEAINADGRVARSQ